MGGFFWANPWGLWGLAALAAVLAAYLFHRKYRPRPVAGLFLWGAPQKTLHGGRRLERPRWRRSFWLDLAACVCLAAALAAPAYRGGARLPLAVILDDGFAMHARENRAAARAAALALAETARDENRPFGIILAGSRPRVLVPFGTPAAEIPGIVEAWYPADSAADLPAALRLALDLRLPPLDLHVVTNQSIGPPAGADSPLTVHRLAGAGGNPALTAVWRRARPADAKTDTNAANAETLYFTIVNYSDSAAEAELILQPRRDFPDDNRPPPERALALAWNPGETRDLEVPIDTAPETTWTARLSLRAGEDVIAEDSRAIIPPAPDRAVTYALADIPPAAARYYHLGLQAAGATEWRKPPAAPPANDFISRRAERPDILIAGTAPAGAARPRGNVMTVETVPPPDDTDAASATYAPPFVVDLSDPLCRDAHLGSLYWTAADPRLRLSAADSPLVMAGDTPLYWRSAAGRLHLNLVPERSEIVVRDAWPALMSNLAEEARRRSPGLRKTLYAPGEFLEYNRHPPPATAPPPAGRVAALHADGRLETVPSHGAFRLPSRPGAYQLRQDGAPAGELAVAALYESASDTRGLARRAGTEYPDMAPGLSRAGVRDLTWLAVGLGFLLLAINWHCEENAGNAS